MTWDARAQRENAQYAERSAERLVPAVLEAVPARSVVDVGCGLGHWAAAFVRHGVADVVGVDADWIDRTALVIPGDRFVAHDLRRRLTLGRRFDLAVCLEVAEHLPADAADDLVDGLVELSDDVLFSAAIPGQRGDGHVNEQWPAYWQERFAARGYQAVDTFRDRFWDDPDVAWWYAQNLLLYRRDAPAPDPPLRALVHPTHYGYVLSSVPGPPPPLPRRLLDAVRRRVPRT